jgi:hypothetical protein
MYRRVYPDGGGRVRTESILSRGAGKPHTPRVDALSALTHAHVPLALAGAGLLLILVVAQSALDGLSHIGRQDQAVASLSRLVRAHQNADMEHDALHADVIELLTGGASAPTTQSRADVLQEAARYRVDLQRLGTAPVPSVAAAQLAAVITQEREYITAAEGLARAPLPRAGNSLRLQDFVRSFNSLTEPMAALTERLAGLEAAASASSFRAHGTAVRRVTAAAGVAVLTLLASSWGLSRTGRRLAQARVQQGFAATLQESLLPVLTLPIRSGVQCAARYLPAAAGADVGGDWYDAFPLPDGNLALVIGDVAGHDMQAASVMGKMRSALRAYALDRHPPSEVLARLNRFTIELHPTVMTTCIYAVYSADTRTLRWANAGHYPPLLVTAAGAEYLQTQVARPPIGARTDPSYLDMVQVMPPHFRLLMFTDGLIERRGHDIDEGLRALAAAAAQAQPGAEELCAAALAACLPQGAADDDVALLAVAIDPRPISEPEPLGRAQPTQSLSGDHEHPGQRLSR